MANELDNPTGLPMTLVFGTANLGANATAAGTLAGGQGSVDGFTVPTGYKFKPIFLYLESNTDLTGGTCTAKVTANNTAIANGPEPELSDTVQTTQAVARATQSAGVAAGDDVGIHFIGASLAPTTAEMDAILVGVLEPQ